MFNRDIEHYVGNNPVKYVDPDGRSDAEPIIAEVRGGVATPVGESFADLPYILKDDLFGPRTSILTKNGVSSSFHKGFDIPVPEGTRVNSILTGKITEVGYNENLGNYVIIEHNNGRTTRYAHLSESQVIVGDDIKAGEQIGLSGNTGLSSGPHLHISYDANGDGDYEDYVDNPTHLLFTEVPQ